MPGSAADLLDPLLHLGGQAVDDLLRRVDPLLPVLELVEHRARDHGRAVVVRNNRVVLATGSAEHVLGTLSELTFGRNAIMPDTDALLAAIGAAWALDIAPDLIGAGIKTFEPELPSVSTLPT